MIQAVTLMWLGTLGLATLFVGMLRGVSEYRAGRSSLVAVLAFAWSLVLFGLFALHASGYLQLIGSGVTQRAATPSLVVLGVLGAATALLLLVDSAYRVIGDT